MGDKIPPQEVKSMEKPLVSIVIPVYNAAPHLAACIESVRKQTYENIEILLVNDGSKDVSLPICRMYGDIDPRIQVMDQENSGVSATRNTAIDRARGEYLQFVDADDRVAMEATQLLVERAQRTQADMVICHYYRVVGKKRKSVHGFLETDKVLTQREFATQLMEEPSSFYYGVMWNKLYRTAIIHDHHIRCSEELGWSEDFLFNLEYIRYCQTFASIQLPLYYYYKNKKGITSTSFGLAKLPQTIETKLNLFEFYKDLYTDMGLYEQYKLQIHKYLIDIASDKD
jgi:glycosyltransferase involved in cell wall biosynthesis